MFNTSEIDSQVQFICTIESICQIELQKRVISIYNNEAMSEKKNIFT